MPSEAQSVHLPGCSTLSYGRAQQSVLPGPTLLPGSPFTNGAAALGMHASLEALEYWNFLRAGVCHF